MHHPVRRKMLLPLILIVLHECSSLTINTNRINDTDDLDNNIIDFDSEYEIKLKKYGIKDIDFKANRYTIVNHDEKKNTTVNHDEDKNTTEGKVLDTTTEDTLSVIPIELLSTTEDALITLVESTAEPDLTVIPLSTTTKAFDVKVTLPSTVATEFTTETIFGDTTEVFNRDDSTTVDYKALIDSHKADNSEVTTLKSQSRFDKVLAEFENVSVSEHATKRRNDNYTMNTTEITEKENTTELNKTNKNTNVTRENINTSRDFKYRTENTNKTIENSTETKENTTRSRDIKNRIAENTSRTKDNATETKENTNGTTEESINIFSELDVEEEDVPEDYYDSKDVIPTRPPSTDALSVIFGLAGSVVESVAERVVPKGIFDLFKRMQKQSEALEAERLRSREENGGIGQFGRGILKSISTSISKPFTQLMAGVRDIGSLDTDRGFVSSAAASVSNVASSLSDAFKTRVQAIYPGTLWCGDGHSAQARSSDLGLFFFTDTCCRQHDACKIYILSGETKYGLTNTGLFTRSHCSCDAQFRECLRKTNSLVSSQIGLTYFNVLGPQCFRKAYPIVRCLKKTRITGQKCEEYELDYSKAKMWQWFDNETF